MHCSIKFCLFWFGGAEISSSSILLSLSEVFDFLQRFKNRLFTSWTNAKGMDCKQVGPETLCFCQHRLRRCLLFVATARDMGVLVPLFWPRLVVSFAQNWRVVGGYMGSMRLRRMHEFSKHGPFLLIKNFSTENVDAPYYVILATPLQHITYDA